MGTKVDIEVNGMEKVDEAIEKTQRLREEVEELNAELEEFEDRTNSNQVEELFEAEKGG